MKRIPFLLGFIAAITIIAAWCKPSFAVQDEAGSASVNAQGQTEGVNLSGGVQTLTVGAAFPDVYTNNRLVAGVSAIDPTASAISTGTADQDTIVFNTSSTVYGTIGTAGNFFKKVDVNDGYTVTFLGTVYTTATADSINIGSSTVNFNSGTSTNIGAITFTADGTASFAANTQITGAIITDTANTGTLSLGSGSKVTGAVTGIKAINVVGGSNSAGVTGTITGAATQIYSASLLTNELSITGGILTMATNGVINTTLASATVYGHIVVAAGNASNLGTGLAVRVTVPTTADFPVGTKFYIVQSTSGTGALATVTVMDPTNPLYTFEVDATASAGDATITVTGIPLAVPVADPPADPVVPVAVPIAEALAAAPTTTDMSIVRAAINALTTASAVVNAEAQLAPLAPALAAPLVTFQGIRRFQDLWLARLDACNAFTKLWPDKADPNCKGEDNLSSNWWVKGVGYYGLRKDSGAYKGFEDRTLGAMVAFDAPMDTDTRAGLGIGYAQTVIDGKTFDTDMNFGTHRAMAYFGHEPGPWFVNGGLSYGWAEYSSRRHISFPGVERTANAKYEGQDYTAFTSAGHHFLANKFMITPFASLQYTRVNIGEYAETGAGDISLKVNSQGYNFYESGLGVKVARDFKLKNRGEIFVPDLHFKWLHDFSSPTLKQTARFNYTGTSTFVTHGLKISEDTYKRGHRINPPFVRLFLDNMVG